MLCQREEQDEVWDQFLIQKISNGRYL